MRGREQPDGPTLTRGICTSLPLYLLGPLPSAAPHVCPLFEPGEICRLVPRHVITISPGLRHRLRNTPARQVREKEDNDAVYEVIAGEIADQLVESKAAPAMVCLS